MKKEEKNDKRDEVFRYALREKDAPEADRMYEDKLVELFRRQIINLLDVVELSNKGKPVTVDGFSFLSERDETYRLYRKRETSGT
jgi:hypothetical protein